MKKYISTSLSLALAAVALTSCEDLDTTPKGQYVTSEAKQEAINLNPNAAAAGVAGISGTMTQYCAVYSNHFDFGYPSTMLGLDMQGQDMVVDWSGYNWFRYWENFTSPTPSGTPSSEAWYTIFKQVFACNAVCASIPSDTEVALNKFYRGQALLARGFDYWVLAQLYQFNYVGHENSPCVPIVTDENAVEVEANGAPRATVQEVYDQILRDLNEAVELIQASGMQPDDVVDSKPKRYGSLATAYGMRARVYLTMGRWAEAAADAQSAISNFRGAPLSISGASVPGFWSLDEANWMWGLPINESDRVVTSGIVNWPSHMNSFTDGYVSVGAWKYCDERLYKAIPNTDVRKFWFTDANGVGANLTNSQQKWLDSNEAPAYTNVKFAGYQNGVGVGSPANDIPLMRIEEMYLILAEAQGMAGQLSAGIETLNNFVNTYRDPSYVCRAESAQTFQNEVWNQRRVELWGEGLSWFDFMRLDKDVNRLESNWPEEASFIVPSLANNPERAKCRIYCIPQGEINGNPAISESDNNPSGNAPSASWK